MYECVVSLGTIDWNARLQCDTASFVWLSGDHEIWVIGRRGKLWSWKTFTVRAELRSTNGVGSTSEKYCWYILIALFCSMQFSIVFASHIGTQFTYLNSSIMDFAVPCTVASSCGRNPHPFRLCADSASSAPHQSCSRPSASRPPRGSLSQSCIRRAWCSDGARLGWGRIASIAVRDLYDHK